MNSDKKNILNLFVSVTGDDENGDGSFERPFQSLAGAVKKAREGQPGQTRICVRGGYYFFPEPVTLGTEDSGLEICGMEGEAAVFGGALRLDGLEWEPWEERPGVWTARTGVFRRIDGLFADGKRQTLCRFPNETPGAYPLGGAATAEEIKERAKGYQNPAGGFLRALHEYAWGGNDYVILGKDANSETGLACRWVGDNNRGDRLKPDAVVVENVLEELDCPGEWYHDLRTGRLYFWPPQGMLPWKAELFGAVQSELIKIAGENAAHPAENIRIKGNGFAYTKRTMFDESGKAYMPLVRGDWCVVPSGALYVENGRGICVEDCRFADIGGNAVFQYGYNAENRVEKSEFKRIRATAVQIVGSPKALYEPSFWPHSQYPNLTVHKTTVDEPDKTGPAGEDYPRDLIIRNNHIEDTGIFEKQSCGVNLSVSSRIRILSNTIHGSARSCVNVNDGSFGGHEIAYNDIFDAQRETMDHGPFNSWGRDRFWSVPEYNASGNDGKQIRHYKKGDREYDLAFLDAYQTTRIHNNRFYHAPDAPHTWGIDLDDGSGNYEICENLCLGMGIKLREGFGRRVYNNILIDGQIQIHVPYEEARDAIYSNLIVNPEPFGFAGADGERLKKTESVIRSNWYVCRDGSPAFPDWMEELEKEAVLDEAPFFAAPERNDYTVKNVRGMEKAGFHNFPMDSFGKPGCVSAPVYRSKETAGGSAVRKRKWKGARVSEIDDAVISSTASFGYEGVFLERVPEDSAAYAMGFRERDIIREIGDYPLRDLDGLEKLPFPEKRESTVQAKIYRANSEQRITLTGGFSAHDKDDFI